MVAGFVCGQTFLFLNYDLSRFIILPNESSVASSSSSVSVSLQTMAMTTTTTTTTVATTTTDSKIDPPSCLYHRGRTGQWKLDWDYANRSDYRNHGSYADWHLADQNFTATPAQPFRLATAYRWIDDKCPVHEVNLKGFCDACLELQINQILIMGDSLSIQFTQALQSLLGFPPVRRRANVFNARFRPWTMTCKPSSSSSATDVNTDFKITFLMERLSPVTDWENLAAQSRKQSGRSIDFIKSSKSKTVIIANLGTWMQTTTEYKQGFIYFLEWLNNLDDPNKVIPFWRPTIPGHLDCLPAGSKEMIKSFDWKDIVPQEPYENYTEYYRIIDEGNRTKQSTGIGSKSLGIVRMVEFLDI